MAECNGRYFITIETTTKKATSMLIQFHRYLIHFENRIKSNKIVSIRMIVLVIFVVILCK